MATYQGPERRQHRLYITKNTEYHLRNAICVGVRDRISGRWIEDHMALGLELAGGLEFSKDYMKPSANPIPGYSLWFVRDNFDVVTSTIQKVDRPPKETVKEYLV